MQIIFSRYLFQRQINFKGGEYLVGAARIDLDFDNIFAGISNCQKFGAHRELINYAFSSSEYLASRGRFAERLVLAQQARIAADSLNDLATQADCDSNLGLAYWNLPSGDRGQNLQRAIACFEAALRIYTERDFPQDWARTQNNLGNAYRNLPSGDRGQNLRRSIGCYEAALRVFTERTFPQDWARTENNLRIVKHALGTLQSKQ
jgi:tetratricopeptide (TPR) repeat protein